MINFVFMLTHSDSTVPGAIDYVEPLAATGLRYIGFKDVGADPETQALIAKAARDAGLETMLEVVSVSREDEIRSVEAAVAAGVDWVLGGTNPDAVLPLLAGSDIRYCPFPGRVVGHPSVLEGEVDEIAASAAALTARPGVHGLDPLAYRHATADISALTRAVVDASQGPVIAAGSVTSAAQIETLAGAGAWGFTIGSAIFDGLLPGAPDVASQVREVLSIAASA
jgi:NAD(P)H-dependent flavin oxidoreductase YrpB (nitropropane dioxygenase family)